MTYFDTDFYSSKRVSQNGSELTCYQLLRRSPADECTTDLVRHLARIIADAANQPFIYLLVSLDDPIVSRQLQLLGFGPPKYAHKTSKRDQSTVVGLLGRTEMSIHVESIECYVQREDGEVVGLAFQFDPAMKLAITPTAVDEKRFWDNYENGKWILGFNQIGRFEADSELKKDQLATTKRRLPTSTGSTRWNQLRHLACLRSSEFANPGAKHTLSPDDVESLLKSIAPNEGNQASVIASAGGLLKCRVDALLLPSGDYLGSTMKASEDGTVSELRGFQQSHLDALITACYQQNWLKAAGAIGFVFSCPDGVIKKYGARGERFFWMYAGALEHHLHLSATAQRLQFRAIGGFDDDYICRIFGTEQGWLPVIGFALARKGP